MEKEHMISTAGLAVLNVIAFPFVLPGVFAYNIFVVLTE